MINRKKRLLAIFVVTIFVTGFFVTIFAVAFIVVGVPFVGQKTVNVQDYTSARLLPSVKHLPDFSLETLSVNSHQFSSEDFNDHWSLVFFGFAECSDICPLTLQQLGQLLQIAQQHNLQQLQVVFISLDLERDAPENIQRYVAAFNPAIIGLRGDKSTLSTLAHFFAIDYSSAAVNSGSSIKNVAVDDASKITASNYQIDHSGRVFIINPHAEYIGSFAPPHLSKNIGSDLQMIIKR